MASESPNRNLTSLYKYIDRRDPRGIIWTRQMLEPAKKLLKQMQTFNKLQTLKIFMDKDFAPNEFPVLRTDLNLNAIESQIQALEADLQSFGPGYPYHVRTLSGATHTLHIPEISSRQHFFLSFTGIIELSENFVLHPNPAEPPTTDPPLYTLTTTVISFHDRYNECYYSDLPYAFWKISWNTGDWKNASNQFWGRTITANPPKITWGWRHESTIKNPKTRSKMEKVAKNWQILSERLKQQINKHATELINVDKVVCFGLGALNVSNPRPFIQHLAARTIADKLEALHGRKIPVLAQDPAYCLSCVRTLDQELGIEAVNDLSAFDALTPNSFILAISPAGPILGMVVDILRGEYLRGPVAMLCDPINDDYMWPEHETDPKKQGQFLPDFSTKNLVKWKKGCDREYVGDAKDWLGKTLETWQEKKPLLPAQMKPKTEEEMREYESSKEQYSNVSQIMLDDASLCVKES